VSAPTPFFKNKNGSETMIWCRYSVGGDVSFGLIEGETVRKVEGTPWGAHKVTAQSSPLASVKLELPVIPSTFFCVGVNYRDHVERMAAKRGAKPSFPPRPDIGYRANNALIAHEENIVKPRDAGEAFQYEGELVAVFGKRCRNVSKENALDYVFGWTIGNDVSERTWQANDRTLWRAKNCDTFKPMGPWIVTGANIDTMVTTIRLNGQVTESFKTNNMIFDAPTYIAEVSRYCTIEPGDVMWMGTDGIPSNMKPGDVCEIEISGIGVLRNRVAAE
jgi:2-keto-4-pentenoate hydratase/2-oxohepta-3-ene-1,7-dioic acid hydratase in catechol pathway